MTRRTAAQILGAVVLALATAVFGIPTPAGATGWNLLAAGCTVAGSTTQGNLTLPYNTSDSATLLVAFQTAANATLPAPTGWTAAAPEQRVNATGASYTRAFYKFSTTSNDGGTFTSASGQPNFVNICPFTGSTAANSDVLDVVAASTMPSPGNTATTPSVTTNAGSDLVLAFVGGGDTQSQGTTITWTAPCLKNDATTSGVMNQSARTAGAFRTGSASAGTEAGCTFANAQNTTGHALWTLAFRAACSTSCATTTTTTAPTTTTTAAPTTTTTVAPTTTTTVPPTTTTTMHCHNPTTTKGWAACRTQHDTEQMRGNQLLGLCLLVALCSAIFVSKLMIGSSG